MKYRKQFYEVRSHYINCYKKNFSHSLETFESQRVRVLRKHLAQDFLKRKITDINNYSLIFSLNLENFSSSEKYNWIEKVELQRLKRFMVICRFTL